MPKQHSTDTQERPGLDSEPRSPESERRPVDPSETTDVEVVHEDFTPGILELARLLEARIETACRELEEKSARIQLLERTLAERDVQLGEARRELEESRDLIAPLAEASQKDAAVTELEVGAAVAEAQVSHTDVQPDSPQIEDLEETSRPELPVEAVDLVAAAMTAQETEHAEDQAEFDGHLSQLSHWTARVDTLRDRLIPTVERAAAELKECGKAFDSLPAELQELLRGRHEGLELIGKMLDRVLDRLPEPGEPPESSLPFIREDEWAALLVGAKSREAADQRVRERLEEVSSKRYKTLSELRRLVETSREGLLRFLKAQLLPILDGIEDGETHSGEVIARLKSAEPKSEESLDIWYRAYGKLRTELLEVLDRIEVRPLVVHCGAPIDYNCQEPFGVEADPDLNTEDVKAVTRTGYEFATNESEEPVVLRPAQVIVVKNPKESNRA